MLLALQAIVDQLSALQAQIGTLERGIHTQHRATEASRRLENIPGNGIIGATAIATAVTDASAFKSGRVTVKTSILGTTRTPENVNGTIP